MLQRLIQFTFFANYFVGFLAIALSVETVFQLELPINSWAYYLLLFSSTVLYYTFAYSGSTDFSTSSNPRTEWYKGHRVFIRKSQNLYAGVFLLSLVILITGNLSGIMDLPFIYWLLVALIPLAAILYYGLLPKSFYRLNLRNSGWLKAFVIGFVWAGCVNILPVVMVRIEYGIQVSEPNFMLWLFVKNWMFCTVNAIMFDIKDYEDDANMQLKTFVVRFGLRKTIFYVLMPLLLLGLGSLLIFTYLRGFGIVPIIINVIPFVSLLFVAHTLQKPKRILYYLIVIDGMLLVKAFCGITGVLFSGRFYL